MNKNMYTVIGIIYFLISQMWLVSAIAHIASPHMSTGLGILYVCMSVLFCILSFIHVKEGSKHD